MKPDTAGGADDGDPLPKEKSNPKRKANSRKGSAKKKSSTSKSSPTKRRARKLKQKTKGRNGSAKKSRKSTKKDSQRKRRARIPKGSLERDIVTAEYFSDCDKSVSKYVERKVNSSRYYDLLVAKDDDGSVASDSTLKLNDNWGRVSNADCRLSYIDVVIRNTVLSAVRSHKNGHSVLVSFRKRSRIKGLLERLKLNNAHIEQLVASRGNGRLYVLHLSAEQYDMLCKHDAVERIIPFSRQNQYVLEPSVDGEREIMNRELAEHLYPAIEDATSIQPDGALVLEMREVYGADWKSIGKMFGRSIPWCRHRYRLFTELFIERNPQLRDHL